MTEQRTILVVDDDQELRQGLQTLLTQHGFRTLTAEDGLEAKKLIDGDRPDLVILDVMMPRLGGFPVLQYFRGQTQAPPFIMITANEQEQCQTAAEKAGAVDYIRKPFSLRRLLHGVHRALGDAPGEGIDEQDSAPRRSFIRCRCPACGARIKSAVHLLGQMQTCPGCQQPMLVRALPPVDEGPKLVIDDEAGPGKSPR